MPRDLLKPPIIKIACPRVKAVEKIMMPSLGKVREKGFVPET